MNRTILKVLTLLGVGSATLVVTACYGPIPENYHPVDMEDDIAYTDSTQVNPSAENVVNE